MHQENSYLTLTYDNEHLPEYGSLKKVDLQSFMKRLRHLIEPRRIKFYGSGEYGDDNKRPHYHVLVFGYMPSVGSSLPPTAGFPLWEAPEISSLWQAGMSAVGQVSFASANYVAGYVMKKVDKVGKKQKYSLEDSTGEIHKIASEFATMSRGGREQLPDGSWRGGRGIGYQWYSTYGEEVERLGTVRANFSEFDPPRYYDSLLRERDEAAYELVKLRRARKHGRRHGPEMRPIEVIDEEKREAMAREVIARKRLEDATRRL